MGEEKQKKKVRASDSWKPTDEHYAQIAELTELGWGIAAMAEYFDITMQLFTHATVHDPMMKAAMELGAENRSMYEERRLSWIPSPAQLAKVRVWAAEGHLAKAIAFKLGVSLNAYNRRVGDTPKLREAVESGEGEYLAEAQEQWVKLRRDSSEDLKYSGGPLMFELKSRGGLTDRPPAAGMAQKEAKNGNIKVTVNLPGKVSNDDIEAFAIEEKKKVDQMKLENKQLEARTIDAEYTTSE